MNFIINSKSEISTKCKNYVIDAFIKNTKINQILIHFENAMKLWNELSSNTNDVYLKNSLLNLKQYEMDSILNIENKSNVHLSASKTINSHLMLRELKLQIEKETIKKSEEENISNSLIGKNKNNNSNICNTNEKINSKNIIQRKTISYTARK
jgi:hypothetical protein